MLTYFVTNEEIISTKNTYPFSNPNPIEPVTVILSIHKQQNVCRELWPSRLITPPCSITERQYIPWKLISSQLYCGDVAWPAFWTTALQHFAGRSLINKLMSIFIRLSSLILMINCVITTTWLWIFIKNSNFDFLSLNFLFLDFNLCKKLTSLILAQIKILLLCTQYWW